MKIKCKCGEEFTIVEDDAFVNVTEHDISILFAATNGLDLRLSRLETLERNVTPYEDLVERHRRLVEYVLDNGGVLDPAMRDRLRGVLHVGG